jgi:hypothetical protein
MVDVNLIDLLTKTAYLIPILVATAIAMVINWIDPPETKLTDAQSWVMAIVGTLIAAFLMAWNNLASGSDISQFNGFIGVVGGALGGIVTIRALLNSPKLLGLSSSPGPGN